MQPLDPGHPRFNELAKEFTNLNSIMINFRQGKYPTTFQLGIDIEKMWSIFFKLYSEEPEKYGKIQEIRKYFEKVFVDLQNKPLTMSSAASSSFSMGSGQMQNLSNQEPKSNLQMSKKINTLEKELKSIKN